MVVLESTRNQLEPCAECGRFWQRDSRRSKNFCAKVPGTSRDCCKKAYDRKAKQIISWNNFLASRSLDITVLEKLGKTDNNNYKHPFDLLDITRDEINRVRYRSEIRLRDNVPHEIIQVIAQWLESFQGRRKYDVWIDALEKLISTSREDNAGSEAQK